MVKDRRAAGSRWMVAALTATVIALGAPAAAHGWTNNYCGVTINEYTWCGDGSDHSYDFNSANYTGGGTVWVCERLLRAGTSISRTNPWCANNNVAHDYGLTSSAVWEAEVSHRTGTGARHTIYGYAVA